MHHPRGGNRNILGQRPSASNSLCAYNLGAEIAQGEAGALYQATVVSTSQRVVCKVINKSALPSNAAAENVRLVGTTVHCDYRSSLAQHAAAISCVLLLTAVTGYRSSLHCISLRALWALQAWLKLLRMMTLSILCWSLAAQHK